VAAKAVAEAEGLTALLAAAAVCNHQHEETGFPVGPAAVPELMVDKVLWVGTTTQTVLVAVEVVLLLAVAMADTVAVVAVVPEQVAQYAELLTHTALAVMEWAQMAPVVVQVHMVQVEQHKVL